MTITDKEFSFSTPKQIAAHPTTLKPINQDFLDLRVKDNRWTYGYLAYGLVRQYLPLQVLEIGLGPQGLGAKAILQALSENKALGARGKYYVIEKELTKDARAVLESFDSTLWHCRVGDTKERDTFLLKQESPIELLFVDGEHTHGAVYDNVANVLDVTNFDVDNGLVVFHDAQMSQVRTGIQKLQREFGMTVIPLTFINVMLGKFNSL